MKEFLMHDEKDGVGVAVIDIKSGQEVQGAALHGQAAPRVK